MEKYSEVYLHTGSNIGDKKAHLLKALDCIEAAIGPIVSKSRIYQTEAWGITNQDDFYNQAILVKTDLKPTDLLQKVKAIEVQIGRKKSEKWTARIIDIDILFWENCIIQKDNLCIPHPHIFERNFVLIPLWEIAPQFVHPILKKSIEELYFACKDLQKVKLLEN